jgi:hypothetical protein
MMIDTIDHLVRRGPSAVAVRNFTGHVVARSRHDVDRPAAPHELREVPTMSIDAGGSWGRCVLVHAEKPSDLGRRVCVRHEPAERRKRLSVRNVADRDDQVFGGARLSGGRADLAVALARSPCAATQNEPCAQEQHSAACEAGQVETCEWKRARTCTRLECRRRLRRELAGGRRRRTVAGDDGTACRCPGHEGECHHSDGNGEGYALQRSSPLDHQFSCSEGYFPEARNLIIRPWRAWANSRRS